MMGILLRLLIGTMALAGPCLAKAHFEFQRLSMGEGLAQSSIEGLVQDRQGYLWVGTQYGLSRHDGYRFRNFQHDPEDPDSLSDSQVVDLRLAGDGRLWVATRDGLNRFDPSTGRAERFYLADDEAVSPQPSFVRQIIGEAADGSLFLRFTDGLALLRSGSSVLERLPFETPISSLGMRGMVGLLDQNERVWVLNDAGLWRLDRNASLLRLIEGVQPARRRTPMASLVESPQGQIAVVAAGGLMLIEPGPLRAGRLIRPRDYEVEADQFDAVTATSDGSFWLMSRTRFMRYRPETDSLALIDEGLPKDPLDRTTFHLNSVEVAPGEFWFATQYGVSRWYEGSRELTVFVYDPRDDHSLPPTLQRVPYRLFVDQDRTLWIGSQLGGLARLSYTARRFDHVVDQSPPGTLPFAGQNVVRAVAETASDNDFQKSVWVGLELGGIRQYQVEGDQHYDLMRVFHAGAEEARRLPGNQVEALALDPVTQRLWAAVGSSLTVIDTGTGEAILDDALSGRSDISAIQTLLFSEDGRRLWVGHSAVNEFLLDDDRLSLSESSNGAYLPELGQFNLLELADGRLVVGGLNGFSVVDFDGGRGGLSLRAQTYFTPGSREIYGLARHPDGGFWMGTRQSGLALVELRPGTAAPQLTWYDRSAGLVDDTVYAVLPEAGGRLWLSSNQGLMRFDPSSGEVRHFTPPDGVQHFEFNNTVAHEGASGRFYFGGINGLNAFDPDSIMILQQAPRLRLSSLRVNGQLRGELLTTPATVRLDHNENDLEMSFVGLHSADPERHRYQHWLEGLDEDWREVGFQRQVRYGGLGSGTYRLWARTANSDGVWSEDALLLTAMVRSPPWASAWALIGYVLLGLFAFLLFWYSIHRRQYLLEAEVMERTQELTEQQVLTRSQARELERALKSRTAFFANVSHEFRTPLTLIQASLNDLNRRLPDAPPLIR
ncbi:MAG: two-component regulator propeller domain-containing protein, partial [Pseudomonadota bacterium]